VEHGKDLSDYIRTEKSSFGRGGMLTKTAIVRKVADEGITVIIANGKRDNILTDLMQRPGTTVCTRFVPSDEGVSSVKKWIAHSEGFAKGELRLNGKAADAVRGDRPVSILPIGVTEVRGEFEKDDVREMARDFGLDCADTPDSMEICFIPGGDYAAYIEARGLTGKAGRFISPDGAGLGPHKGVLHYTVGQRKGLGVAAEGRLFVHELRPETDEVVLSLEDVYRKEIAVRDVHYIAPEYAENGAFSCEVRVRFSKRSDRATVYPDGENARIVFEDAVRAPAKGQSAVFYDGDIVIGGGFIV
jgi:hypothetical protein